MNNFTLSLALPAALLLAGSALAQTIPLPNPPSVTSDRADRRCTTSALSTDASAPCADDALNDRPRTAPRVVHPRLSRIAGNGKTSTATAARPNPERKGKAASGATGIHQTAR